MLKKRKAYWDSVPAQSDKQSKAIEVSKIPITVIATKYDTFAQQTEPKAKKLFCQALRYIAHKSGADLIFSSIKETNPLRIYKSFYTWHTFRDMASANQPEV